jgi:hypothetical protein
VFGHALAPACSSYGSGVAPIRQWKEERFCAREALDKGHVWFGFFLKSFSEKLAVEKSWLWGEAGG